MSEERPQTPAPEPWFKGIEGADLGVIQTRNWDKLPAAEAAREAFKAMQEATAFANRIGGAPASEIVRFPSDPADPGWAEVHKRLGVPEDKAAYDFSALKFSDGSEVADALTIPLRDAFHSARLTPLQAQAAASAFVKFIDESMKAETSEAAATASAEAEKLRLSWGDNEIVNRDLAMRGAARLGFSAEEVTEIGNGPDGAAKLERFRQAGQAMGEARFITGTNPRGNGIMSLEQAEARRTELLADRLFQQRVLARDPEATRELEQLDTMIVRGRMGRAGA